MQPPPKADAASYVRGDAMLQGIGQPSPLVSSVISAMITPAILILATGNLIGTSMALHNRIIDRTRFLIQRYGEVQLTDAAQAAFIKGSILLVRQRIRLAAISISAYYLAVGCFVASSLVIAVTVALDLPHWIPAALTVVGAVLLFAGSIATFYEMVISNQALGREVEYGLSQIEPAAEKTAS
jgi:hypothetical protein